MNDAANNPYLSSKKANLTGPWYDSFAKSGELAWLVFWGPQLLAEVKNEQQAKNIMAYLELIVTLTP